jgi:hypothetical protein
MDRLRGAQIIATKYHLTVDEAEQIRPLARQLVLWRLGQAALGVSERSAQLNSIAMGWAIELPNDIDQADEILSGAVEAVRWINA